MRKRIKFIGVVILFLLVITPVYIDGIVFGRSNTGDIPVVPRLSYPTGEEATITGGSLTFKWWHASMGIDRFEFALYKGGGPFGNVLVAKVLPFNASSIEVDASLFENNQVYTWTLRQIGDNGLRSEKSFATFKVIKQ